MKAFQTLLLSASLLLSAARGQQTTQSQPQATGQQRQPAQTGCPASPIKKPRFHIPKSIQDAINRRVKQINDKAGIELDPNAPGQVIKDAQQDKPCPAAAPPNSAPKQSASEVQKEK